MWILLKHKVTFWVSVIVLGGIGLFTAWAGAQWGREAGLLFGILAFLTAGGLESAWYLSNRRRARRLDEQAEQDLMAKSQQASENNPTIR